MPDWHYLIYPELQTSHVWPPEPGHQVGSLDKGYCPCKPDLIPGFANPEKITAIYRHKWMNS